MKKSVQNIMRKVSNFAMLAVLSVSSLLSSAPAFAANTTGDVTYNHNNITEVTYSDATGTGVTWMTSIYLNRGNGNELVFCVEPHILVQEGPGYNQNPFLLNRRVSLISTLWKYAGTDDATYFAAQKMIWAEIGTTITSIAGYNMADIAAREAAINNVIANYEKKPSFANSTVKLNAGESVTLTDTNGSDLSAFNNVDTNSANVNYSVNGNKLTITAKDNSNSKGQLILEKGLERGTPYIWKKAGSQSIASSGIADPADYLLNLEITTTGTAQVSKTDSATGVAVPGTEFTLTYPVNGSNVSKKITTGNNGIATLDGIPHNAKVKVQETFVPAPYVLASATGGVDTKEITIKAGHTTTVDFNNQVATGKTTLTKIDKTTGNKTALNPNYPMTGAVYGLFKENGTLVKEFTLGADLTASIDKLPLGTYYWKETKASTGYTLDLNKYTVALTYKDQNTAVIIKDGQSTDDVIRMNLDGQKVIQNATNEMYKNGVEFTATNKRTGAKTVVTTANVNGKDGYFKLENLPLDDYVITETKGVDGYKNIDPIEVNHKYDSASKSFTFIVKDQKSGNVLNSQTLTQETLQNGTNVNLGTYLLKDIAEKIPEPELGINTQAHTDDGESQLFTFGGNTKFYDKSTLTHKYVKANTKRAYETKLHAVYTARNGKVTDEVVWSSGLIDYTLVKDDETITTQVLADYDYKGDPKADEKTRWYFSEDGYNYDKPNTPTKDVEHNPKGDDPRQDLNPLTPEVGINTLAHLGNSKDQVFVWGENVTFYDESHLSHVNIKAGTDRAYETKLHAVYTDEEGNTSDEVVWASGLIDYKVTDEMITHEVLADYNYKDDPKADVNTTWYFSEDGYNKYNPTPEKDVEHNPKGEDPKQAIKPVEPKLGISTNAHIGDGESQRFVWGENVVFYDNSDLTHENLKKGTDRAYETKLHAVYTDKDGNVTDEVVWSSGLIDYTLAKNDESITNQVIAEYDYKQDPKADKNTTWYFSEDGYNKYNEPPVKDVEHNPKGDDPKQAIKPIIPKLDISTQAHTGDGLTQTFVWGDNVTFYDDSYLIHDKIPAFTERAYETKLHAVYTDDEGNTSDEVVWESGLIDYEVMGNFQTARVVADYNYKKDPKANVKTRWYFSEDGYNKYGEEPEKDVEHNPDGSDKKQDITPTEKPVVPTPPTPEKPILPPVEPEKPIVPGTPIPTVPIKNTPQPDYPTTGEQVIKGLGIAGVLIVVAAGGLFFYNKKSKE